MKLSRLQRTIVNAVSFLYHGGLTGMCLEGYRVREFDNTQVGNLEEYLAQQLECLVSTDILECQVFKWYIAKRHGKKLVSVSNDMLQKYVIPDGKDEIPIFHFGMKGIDRLNGKFDVIWEVNAHYYHRQAILQAMFDKFNVKPDLDVKPQKDNFVSTDPNMQFETHRYVYDPMVELELEHTQIADMEQTIGRFLREEDVYKVIYRTHNVNIKPYPSRVYKSWKALFKYEFGPYVPAEAWLTGKAAEVWEWMKESLSNADEFTADMVAQGVGMSVQNVTQRHLRHFISTGLLEIVSDGNQGRGHATFYKIAQNVDVD